MSPNGDMKPNNSELVVLKALWRRQPQSLREIHIAISDELDWSRSSTRKTVERMVDKGLLSVGDAHGLKIYRAKVKKVPTLGAMISRFAADVLGLDGPLPVSNLVESHLLNDQELVELEEYLRKKSSTNRGPNKSKDND